jgi:hypothetical protein
MRAIQSGARRRSAGGAVRCRQRVREHGACTEQKGTAAKLGNQASEEIWWDAQELRKDRQGETLVHPWRMAPEALPPGGGLLLPRLHKPDVVRTRHHTVCDFLPRDRGTGRTADDLERRASVIRTDLIDPCGLGAGEPAGPNPGGISLQEL